MGSSPDDGRARARRRPSPARSRTCARAAIRRPRRRTGCGRRRLRAGRGARDLVDFLFAIDREQAHAELEGARDVALLLDRVAEGDALGRGAGIERQLDLGDGGRVEARAQRGQQAQDLRRRVGLHGVEDARVSGSAGRRRGSCRARRRDRRPGRGRRDVGWRGSRGCAGWPSKSPGAACAASSSCGQGARP
jgi:hypothetical protein